MSTEELFSKHNLGKLELKNRIVMPPMTRSRAGKGDVPTELMATYYAQRASAGLIVTEGTQISPQGQGYAWTPGIYSPEQVIGWQKVTKAVHGKDGVIFAQLWHVGRISHVELQPNGESPVSSSELVAEGVKVFIDPEGKGHESGAGEMIQHSKPRVLSIPEIKSIVEQYGVAAQNAMDAGFDGVEVHAANGYLINQFIDSQANTRTDEYGGPLENRLRFLKEVITEIAKQIGAEKIGVRLAPFTSLNGTVDDTPESTYLEAAKLLNHIGVAYIHIAEADWEDAPGVPDGWKDKLRDTFGGAIIYAGYYDREKAEAAIVSGEADLIGFGRATIANPDLPRRLKEGLQLNEADSTTFFGGTEKGYTDYPFAP
ncbi:alkene reductase [Desulforhopalus sp. 52FAK]